MTLSAAQAWFLTLSGVRKVSRQPCWPRLERELCGRRYTFSLTVGDVFTKAGTYRMCYCDPAADTSKDGAAESSARTRVFFTDFSKKFH